MTHTTHSTPQAPDESAKAARLIEVALATGPRPIAHATARLIAAAINEGGGSPLEHFAATGQFDVELAGHEAQRVFVTTRQEPWRRALLEFLLSMRRSHPWGGSYHRPQTNSKPRISPQSGPHSTPGEPAGNGQQSPKGVQYWGNEHSQMNLFDVPTRSPAGSSSGVRAASTSELVLTVPEAAERLRISQWTLYRLLREGRLRSIQVGARRLIPLVALREFVEHGDDRD